MVLARVKGVFNRGYGYVALHYLKSSYLDLRKRQFKVVCTFCYNTRHEKGFQHRGALPSRRTLHATAAARLPDVMSIIDGRGYFVLHAFRSPGKIIHVVGL